MLGLRGSAVGLLLLATAARADIPVHCHRAEVSGEWELTLSQAGDTRLGCGHQRPDAVAVQPEDLMSAVGKVQVDLDGEDHSVRLLQGFAATGANASSATALERGRWTMVADEGFEVTFPPNLAKAAGLPGSKAGLETRLFAFSYFHLEGHPKLATPSSKSVQKCNQTLVGWYAVGRQQWGCWVGKQVKAAKKAAAPKSSFLEESPPRRAARRAALPGRPKVLDAPLSQPMLQLWTKAITARARGKWTAKPYARWAGMSLSQLRRKRGLRPGGMAADGAGAEVLLSATSRKLLRSRKNSTASGAAAGVELAGRPLLTETYLAGLAEAEKSLPDSVDWRDRSSTKAGILRKNYLEPVMDQADCGSCYAVAAGRMINARHKIKVDRPDDVPFSISFPLYCSEYNQGCDGGYGYLHAKWSEEVGLLPANCAPYTPHGTSCSVNNTCVKEYRNLQKAYRVSDYRYLGGHTGGATAALILQELATKGPVVVGISGEHIGDDFMFYSSGVYTGEEDPPADSSGGHAVLVVGYGTDELTNEKYWLVQNSWGPDWGEDGYIRMARRIVEFKGAEACDVVEDEQNGKQVDILLGNPIGIAQNLKTIKV